MVNIPDPNLEAVIMDKIKKEEGPITKSDLQGITELEAEDNNIRDITGIEHCVNLERLVLGATEETGWKSSNEIEDISPLEELTKLTELNLRRNKISDITPLSNLTNLTELWLFANKISDLTPLSNLTNLTRLELDYNQISDIAPLSNLTNLTWLELHFNRITDITPLENLTNLTELWLYVNRITDITPLENLTKLTRLSLRHNQIEDIQPLIENKGLAEGDRVDLQGNPLNETSIETFIPKLKERGVDVEYIEPKVKLEHKLSVGDRLVSESTSEAHVWANPGQMGGLPFEQTANAEATTTIDVVSVDESGVIEMKRTYKQTSTERQFDGEPKTTTTEWPPLTYKVKKTGEVVLCDIGEYELRHPQNPAEDTVNWFLYIGQQILLAVLPDKEVEVGDVWTTETLLKSPDGGELKMTTTSKLFALGKVGEYDCAWIQGEGNLPIRVEFRGDFEGYSYVVMEGTVSGKGMSYFAYKEGRTIEGRGSWGFEMTVEIVSEEESAKAFSIMHVNETSTTSLSKQTQ